MSEEKKTQAQLLVELVTGNPEIELFHDEQKDAFARIVVADHKETWSVASRQFKLWLSNEFRNTHDRIPHNGAITSAVQMLEGEAVFKGKMRKLHTRVARVGDEIWYDLCDEQWRAVRVTPEGWSVVSNPPIIFRRYKHQAAQVEPSRGANVQTLLSLLNVVGKDNEILFLVYLISCLIPGFPHPILYVHGPQGSAKSTLSKVVRRLIDPSLAEVLSLPRDNQELVQVLAHHYLLFFDNVSAINDQAADYLCRAVTGTGFSKRQLYTDSDDIIYNILSCIGINGIDLGSLKPDLLERSILLPLERIDKSQRRQERELNEIFDTLRPHILGAALSAVSEALKRYATIFLTDAPRMADFAAWGCAIAEAIDIPRNDFMDAYYRNIGMQTSEVLNEQPIAVLVMSLMDDRTEWEGTMAELHAEIRKLGEAAGYQHFDIPKTANVLSRRLGRLKVSLEEVGVTITKSKGTKRKVMISKRSDGVVSTSESDNATADQDDKDDPDDTFEQISEERGP